MSSESAVILDHVSKRYRISHVRLYQRSLRSAFTDGFKAALRLRFGRDGQHDFWSLRDICLELRRGETVGIIGPNGAGKTTILKLLSGITYPTEGWVETRGRVASLIHLGAGFHDELTGRENVYLYGSILGLKRRHIRDLFDEIVDFAGVREFIDTPVKRYSSGMFVRLGFSVAIHVQPEILLIDEVLAVGDEAFRAKCYDRIRAFQQQGTTMIIVSHDLGMVQRLCPRTVLLASGRVEYDGETAEAIQRYQGLSRPKGTSPSAR